MSKLYTAVDKMSQIISWISIVGIAVICIMYTADVIGRLVLKEQIRGTFEIAQFVLCVIVFAAFPLTQTVRSHIHVGFIVSRLPKRAKYAISVFNFLICTVMCIVASSALYTQGALAARDIKLSAVLKIPFSPIYYFATVMMILFAATILVDMIRAVTALTGNEKARENIDRFYL